MNGMSRDELLQALSGERLKVNQEILQKKRVIREAQAAVDALEARLRDIDHAEGHLR